MDLIFYDTETTGTDPAFDQILQFAAVRTDAELNEVDRFETRCRISPRVVPSPGALRVNGVTASQLIDPSLPSHYEMVSRIREKLLEWAPATFLGYNSMRFDEPLLRQAFYKSLFPPYLTNTNGNCRSDVMRAVQAATLHVPNAIAVPLGSNSQHSFKLDQVAPENGYSHESAHDALDDVRATIHLARLLAEKAPGVWAAFMRFSNKAAVIDYLSEESIVALSDFYFGNPYSWHVTLIGENVANSSEQYVFNLGVDPDELEMLSDKALTSRLATQPKPVRSVRSNAAPMLMPSDEAPHTASTWSISIEELERRAQRLREDAVLRERLVAGFEASRPEREPPVHVEQKIYDGFFSPVDQARMDAFHRSSWEARPAIVSALEDPRLRELGMRLIYAERPDVLAAELRSQYQVEIAEHLTRDNETVRWLTLPKAIEQVEDLIAVAGDSEREFLRSHQRFLLKRLEDALGYLT